MRAAAAFVIGFMVSSTALAEPHPLPPGVSAAWVVEGTARLRIDGATAPDSHLTLLPSGVYFTEASYKELTASTSTLQRDLANVRASLAAHESAPVVAPPVLRTGWSTRTLLWVLFGGVVLGGGVVYVAGGGR